MKVKTDFRGAQIGRDETESCFWFWAQALDESASERV